MKYLLYTCMLFTLFACMKDNEKDEANKTLIGKWKLTVSAMSSGGPMVEYPADPTKPTYMELKSNGVLEITPAQANGPDQYSIEGNKVTFTSSSDMRSTIYEYTIQNGVLKLWPVQPMCIEGCYKKYITVR